MFEKLLSLFERLVLAAEKIAGGAPAAAATAPVAKPARGKPAAKDTPPPAADLDLDGPGADEDFLGGESEPTKKYTRDEVRAALIEFGKRAGDPAKARAVLKSVGGVEILSELKEDKFAAVVEAAKK